MPNIGEIGKGRELGYKGSNRYIRHACVICGRERWVILKKGTPVSLQCSFCASAIKGQTQPRGEKSKNWRGGRHKSSDGYILLWLSKEDFFFSMATISRGKYSGYVFEHRIVMAKHLGRCLQSWELVHHKDGIRDHNTFSNLKMTTKGSHSIEHSKGYRDGYQKGYQDAQAKVTKELKDLVSINEKIEELKKLIEKEDGNGKSK